MQDVPAGGRRVQRLRYDPGLSVADDPFWQLPCRCAQYGGGAARSLRSIRGELKSQFECAFCKMGESRRGQCRMCLPQGKQSQTNTI